MTRRARRDAVERVRPPIGARLWLGFGGAVAGFMAAAGLVAMLSLPKPAVRVLALVFVAAGAGRGLSVSAWPTPDLLVVRNLLWTHLVPWRSIWQFTIVSSNRGVMYDRRAIERRRRTLPIDAVPAWERAVPSFAAVLRWCAEHDAWAGDPPEPG